MTVDAYKGDLGSNRIISIDIMRGVAIFGIFLVNMLSFHSPLLYIDPIKWWNHPLDRASYMFVDIFAQASFYPLFAMLFGYGYILLRESTLKKGRSFPAIMIRRLSLLLVIGILHASFVWHGDILINYALLGFVFLPFVKLSGKTMLLTGSILYILSNLMLALLLAATVLFVPESELDIYDQNEAEISVETYQQGSFVEVTKQRVKDWYVTNNLENGFLMLFTIFPFFLIGGGAAKLKWFESVQKYKKKFMYLVFVFFTIGMFIKLLPYIFTRNLATDFIQDIFGGPFLTLTYALTFALLTERAVARKWLSPLASVGKLSMSNYLFQSIFSTLIFYSYGLGLYGKVSAFQGLLLVFAIYTIQIIVSRIWVRKFHYGPLEWLWRGFTYWQKPIWRRG